MNEKRCMVVERLFWDIISSFLRVGRSDVSLIKMKSMTTSPDPWIKILLKFAVKQNGDLQRHFFSNCRPKRRNGVDFMIVINILHTK